MSRKHHNPTAQRTVEQINSTLSMLYETNLALAFNTVPPVNPQELNCIITWENHQPGRVNAGESFSSLKQYEHILNTNSYHCLLIDGSIIRVSFKFEKDQLRSQNLLWWPSPIPASFVDLGDTFPPLDIIEDFYSDVQWHTNIVMRSPVRIDFDDSNNTLNHPAAHMHIQNSETRIYTKEPICFNRFIDFIFRNFYPGYKYEFNEYDYIDYKTKQIEKIEYNPSTIIF